MGNEWQGLDNFFEQLDSAAISAKSKAASLRDALERAEWECKVLEEAQRIRQGKSFVPPSPVVRKQNFSGANRGNRNELDCYQTPYSMTQQLLDLIAFDKSSVVLEPACGKGAIVKVLQSNGYDVVHYDKDVDFLTERKPYRQLITNPPFSLALEFILKAKDVAADKFALLLPLNYLQGQKRHAVYQDKTYPLASVNVFSRYPSFGGTWREDGKYKTAMLAFAWFVWDKSHQGPPAVQWIDNQRFVVSARSG